jgi:signal peptidase I
MNESPNESQPEPKPEMTTALAHQPRKPILALAAGLVMPGLGHVYGGDVVRGVSYLLAVALVVPGTARLALHAPVRWLCFTLFAGVVAAVALYIWSAIEAFRRARRPSGEGGRAWQRPAVYALYAVVAAVFVLAPLTAAVRDGVLETFVVPSASMMPNVLPGDRIVADKTVGHPGGARLWRGALAIFVNPNDRALIFIKRVIALPGDRVEIEGAEVRINGSPLAVPAGGDDPAAPEASAAARLVHERGDHGTYAVLRPTGNLPPATAAPAATKLVVPDGQVFVLGDNRASAVDSRRFGTIPLVDVKGIARQIWFSSGHGDGVRWRRVGRLLD